MLALIDFEPIFEDQLCFLSGSAQFRMLINVARSHNGAGEALQAVLQFSNPLHNLGCGCLRLDIAIERDLAFDLLNVLGDGGFVVVSWMDDPRNDACQWIGIRHEIDYKSDRALPQQWRRFT